MKKLKAFLKKWWLWISVGIVLLGLFVRRAVVLRTISELRRKLTAAERDAEAEAVTAAVKTQVDEINHHQDMAEYHRARAAIVAADLAEAEKGHAEILDAITGAKNWDELERLRQEGNARL